MAEERDKESPSGPSPGPSKGGGRISPLRLKTEIIETAPVGPKPERIGQYRIKRIIATGGMGTVYEAIQEHPKRTVAVKVLKEGIASRSVLRRFEYESQILARLLHPAIAQVYESGTHRTKDQSSGGVPYFVMEYIPNARPITEYARRKNLGTRERLELFKQVCDAVHHGHQKGIIHRDLKPANILVDSHGQVKIIDFGVARATGSEVAVTTLQTDVGQLIGTVQYMSPEQVDADPHDIDTRSDVYALGIVLFELLTGHMPYNVENIPVYEATRLIREQPPTKLSVVNRRLRGDVETIVMKALEKDRERRYQSADELRRDIDRYLKGEPISARPPSVGYQLRVFARRNKSLVGAFLTVLLVLVTAVIVSTSLYVRANEARTAEQEQHDAARLQARRAETISAFLERMLASVNPREAGPNVQVREVLDQAAASIDTELSGEPEIRASLHDTIGRSYLALKLPDQAAPHLKTALQLRRQLYGERHPLFASSLHQAGILARRQGKLEAGNRMIRRAYSLRRELLGDVHLDIAESYTELAWVNMSEGDYESAEDFLRKALEIRRELQGEHRDVAKSLEWLARILVEGGRYSDAEVYLREALDMRRRVLGRNHFEVAENCKDLGEIYWHRAEFDKAIQIHRERIRICSEVLGEDDIETRSGKADLAAVYKDMGDLATAEALYREGVRGREGPSDDPAEVYPMHMFAFFLREQGRYREAEPLCRATYRLWGHSPDGTLRTHPAAAYASHNLAALLFELGQIDEAERLHRQAIRIWRDQFGTNNTVLSRSLIGLGRLLQFKGEYEEAEDLFRQSLEMCRRRLGPDNPKSALSQIHLAGVLQAQGKPGAEKMCREGLAHLRDKLGNQHHHVVFGLSELAAIKRAEGDSTSAESLFREAVEIERKLSRQEHPILATCLTGLGELLASRGDSEAALPLLREAVQIRESRLPEGHWAIAQTECALGACLTDLGELAEAEPLLVAGHAAILDALGAAHPETAKACGYLSVLYDALGQPEKAAAFGRKPHASDSKQ